MSPIAFILVSAALLSVPVTVKYCLALATRQLVESVRQRERDHRALAAQLEALEQECLITRRALRQVEGLRRQAEARRSLATDRLHHYQHAPNMTMAAG